MRADLGFRQQSNPLVCQEIGLPFATRFSASISLRQDFLCEGVVGFAAIDASYTGDRIASFGDRHAAGLSWIYADEPAGWD